VRSESLTKNALLASNGLIPRSRLNIANWPRDEWIGDFEICGEGLGIEMQIGNPDLCNMGQFLISQRFRERNYSIN
jgi:hypothetical protein